MKKLNYEKILNNIFFKNSVFNRKIKNNRSVFNNVKYVYSIGDIHGDFQTFKDTILEIGQSKYISNGNNIFTIYNKNIFGITFELCKINKENIKNDNFMIVQLGDLFYSAYKYDLENNEEIRLIFFIFSLSKTSFLLNFSISCIATGVVTSLPRTKSNSASISCPALTDSNPACFASIF